MTLEVIRTAARQLPRAEMEALCDDLQARLLEDWESDPLAVEAEHLALAVDRDEIETTDGPRFFARLREGLAG